ncbi:hypothetical protein K493DRAFT_311474 [Basidiobolus meristosporus CBS 931.73]|uniref:Homeodomain-like protein n=1 Tax=Basidiobolus meristosporus CBS 931.73 TaxID=1314790 RepID=A0A1Y1Z1L7_9FUNG|nr:hypothetical protein K493DRAFT_311474 [Basidiobolus meristosporus CBS 931.73]|eukprot:ORY04182.1 hypothetical protein K493DRAFT_311474 [Basidiobolus meristosporus CBS 931.73]
MSWLKSRLTCKLNPLARYALTRSRSNQFSTTSTLRILNWTPEENERLIRLVDEYGEKWSYIARSFPGRQLQTLRYHYLVKLKPEINLQRLMKSKGYAASQVWTEDDEKLLHKLVLKHGFVWTVIQKEGFQTRSCAQLKSKYLQGLRTDPRWNVWTHKLDDTLLNAIQSIGFDNWEEVSKLVKGKTPECCQNRWLALKTEAAEWKNGQKQKAQQGNSL